MANVPLKASEGRYFVVRLGSMSNDRWPQDEYPDWISAVRVARDFNQGRNPHEDHYHVFDDRGREISLESEVPTLH